MEERLRLTRDVRYTVPSRVPSTSCFHHHISNETMISIQTLRLARMRCSPNIPDATCVETEVEEATGSTLLPCDDEVDALDSKGQEDMTMAMDGQPPFECPYCGWLFKTILQLKYASLTSICAGADNVKAAYQSATRDSTLTQSQLVDSIFEVGKSDAGSLSKKVATENLPLKVKLGFVRRRRDSEPS